MRNLDVVGHEAILRGVRNGTLRPVRGVDWRVPRQIGDIRQYALLTYLIQCAADRHSSNATCNVCQDPKKQPRFKKCRHIAGYGHGCCGDCLRSNHYKKCNYSSLEGFPGADGNAGEVEEEQTDVQRLAGGLSRVELFQAARQQIKHDAAAPSGVRIVGSGTQRPAASTPYDPSNILQPGPGTRSHTAAVAQANAEWDRRAVMGEFFPRPWDDRLRAPTGPPLSVETLPTPRVPSRPPTPPQVRSAEHNWVDEPPSVFRDSLGYPRFHGNPEFTGIPIGARVS